MSPPASPPPCPRRRGWAASPFHPALGSAVLFALLASLGVGLISCAAAPPAPNSVGTPGRVALFPASPPGLRAPARVLWCPRQIPFIDAGDDADVPYLLGMVHAHLRLGQMEILKRISQGRLAEMAGPVATNIDHSIRTIDFGRAADAILGAMRPDTRVWVERYVEGINDYRALTRERPVEFAVLGLDPDEGWTARDVVTLGRLAGTDINWVLWYNALRFRREPGWAEVYARVLAHGAQASTSFGAAEPLDLFADVARSGSNSFVVAGSRTRSGAGLIASDPHVGFNLPALWTLVQYRSPSTHVLGFTIAGLPVVLLGRNERIGWGGTNMQSLNSALYDVSTLPAHDFSTRRVTIRQRFWMPATRTIRESPHGPVISDAPLFAAARETPVALRWRGHEPSDEISAFLDVSRARCFEQFRAAFEPYAVSGQNFLYADADGRIGQVMAVEFDPAAAATALAGIGDPTNPDHAWGRRLRSTQLPFATDPPQGFLVSTNNTPVRTDPPVSLVTNWNDRQHRLTELLAADDSVDPRDAARFQMDVFSESSLATARALADRLDALALAPGAASRLRGWDGRYTVDATAPVLYTALLHGVASRHYTRRYSPGIARLLLGLPAVHDLARDDIVSGAMDQDLRDALPGALAAAPPSRAWGDVHRLRVQHWIGLVPFVGRSYRFEDRPVPGSSTTVHKTAAGLAPGVHFARYGANARHVSDLSDPDENYFVLLGGQDGWLGSATFMDQIDLWAEGGSVRVPMRPEVFERQARWITRLTPPSQRPPVARSASPAGG